MEWGDRASEFRALFFTRGLSDLQTLFAASGLPVEIREKLFSPGGLFHPGEAGG